MLYLQGDRADDIHFVDDGLVKLVHTTATGSEVIVAFRGREGIVGDQSALAGLPRAVRAEAMVDTTIRTVPRERVVRAVRNDPELALALLEGLARRVQTDMAHLARRVTGDAPELVAAKLLQLVSDPMFDSAHDGTSGAAVVRVPISQSDLASWAGVSRRSVSSTLRSLRDDGVITTGRQRLVVHDICELDRRADPVRTRTGGDIRHS